MNKRTFRACLSLFRIRAAESLQYRMAALSGAVVGIVYALIEIAVFTAFFKYGENTAENFNGLDLPRVVSYAWLVQVLCVVQFQVIDSELHQKITSGDVGIELCRPLDLYWHWFAKSAAGKAGVMVLRGGMTMLAGAGVTLLGFGTAGLGAPSSGENLFLFILSAAGAFVFVSAYSMLMTAVRMNIQWGDGPIHIISTVGMVLSASGLPLQLWPDSMQRFLLLQPFASSVDIPARLYIGSIARGEAAFAIALQILWAAAFIIAGRTIMARRLRAVIMQGG